jgi:deoxyribodipyrimidine photolyase
MNMFAKAAAVAPAKPKTAKATDTANSIVIKGVEEFAAICAVMKQLEALQKTLAEDLKNQGVDMMVTEGMRLQRAPESIKAHEGLGNANIQLRCKGSNIALSAEDAERLTAAGIPLQTVDNVVETYVINPAYKDDQGLLEQVSKALAKVKGLPEDFIQLQQDQKVCVDGDNTLSALMRLKDREQVEALLPLVAVKAIRPSFKGNTEAAIKTVADLLGFEEQKAAKPAKAKKAAAA